MDREQYGRYEIRSKLGQGGMATVYLAHDPRFGRDVALKVMNPGLHHEPTFRNRFEREARTIAALEHAAIVPVYDFGEDHQQLYLVMRYMSGGTLADKVGHPFSLPDLLPIFRRIAAALDHAHAHNIVHRDLKPANILFDQYHNAFLSDFGIVKVAQETANLTGNSIIGTPAYMSPEQIHGDQAIDGRADIYTLGIILFECLSGYPPYQGDTPVKQMMSHVLQPVPTLSARAPHLSPVYDAILHKALAKEPDGRYATATLLVEALANRVSLSLPDPVADDERTETAVLPLPAPVKSTPIQPMPPAPILVTPPKPEREPPTYVGKAALSFTKTPSTPLADVVPPMPTAVAGKKRPWAWLGLLLLLGLLLIGARYRAQLNQRTAVESFADRLLPTHTFPPPPTRPTPTALATPLVVQINASAEALLPTPSAAPITVTVAVETIGFSALGKPITVTQVGDGPTPILFVGGLHAGFTPASVELAEKAIRYFNEHPAELPTAVTLYIITNANPDSPLAAGLLQGRLNGNGVDLNRNWGCRWTASPPWPGSIRTGLGGSSPLSEPETQALDRFIREIDAAAVVLWQGRANAGLVSPGACHEQPLVSLPLALAYGRGSTYTVENFEQMATQPLNGDMTNWLDSQNIPAISVLLPNYDISDADRNVQGMKAAMQWVLEAASR